jgi:DNA-binding NarL/FixJ family response regulator
MLRLLLGYDLAVQAAMTLGAALDGLGSEPPDLVLLAGRLGPQADAPAVLGILAKLGCRAPVIALVDRCDREAGRALMAASAIGVIERDDLSASRLLEALLDGLPQVAAAETC